MINHKNRRTNRKAFTLVELLVVILLIGILSGMTALMMGSAREDAMRKKTQRLVETVEQILLSEMNELSFSPPSTTTPVTGAGVSSAYLIARRDQQRLVFPDRRGDLLLPPVQIHAAPSVAVKLKAPTSWLRMRSKLKLDSSTALPGSSSDVRLANLFDQNHADNVYTRTSASTPSSSVIPDPAESSNPANIETLWTREYESAECLYLILSTIDFNGTPAIDLISRNVANTDGDLVPEIVDAWGKPLLFIRWPVGAPELTSTSPDPFDYTQTDPRYATATTPFERPFRIAPLVASAGPDGEFGIFSSPASIDENTTTDFSFADIANPYAGSPAGRFPDPYYNLGQSTTLNSTNQHLISAARYNVSTSAQGGGVGSLFNVEYAQDNISSLQN